MGFSHSSYEIFQRFSIGKKRDSVSSQQQESGWTLHHEPIFWEEISAIAHGCSLRGSKNAAKAVASLLQVVVKSIQLRQRGTPLIKQDIVHHVIERTGLPRSKAEAAVDTVFEGLKQALTAGERIELRGFGVFSIRARKTGIGRNPRTGTEVSIKPGKAVRFKPGKELHTLETV
jgi:DNA-binding protein HU-beta